MREKLMNWNCYTILLGNSVKILIHSEPDKQDSVVKNIVIMYNIWFEVY